MIKNIKGISRNAIFKSRAGHMGGEFRPKLDVCYRFVAICQKFQI